MEVKFKSISSTSNFVTWLKGFKDVQPSLLIEADFEDNAFIAKSFPEDRSIVKYSKISFEDAGYEFAYVNDNQGNTFEWNEADIPGKRVKLGIYEILSKLIEVENMFSETDHDLILNFDVCKNVIYIGANKPVSEYQGTSIVLKSLSLTMTIKCTKISEFFTKLDDETFLNKVCNIGSPSNYEVSPDALNNLYKIASVFAVDKSRDIIKFYSKVVNDQRALYAYDETNSSFDYLLGYFKDGEDGDNSTVVFKENFINATKGLGTDNLIITLDTAGASRILVDTGSAKVIVAAAKNVSVTK